MNLIFYFLKNIGLVLLAYASEASVGGSNNNTPPANPATFAADFYQFALIGSGILAFVVIVFGAIRYAVASGNPSIQSDAKDQITQAILGLILLLSTYIILNTIHPNLTKLKLPTLEKPQTSQGGGT